MSRWLGLGLLSLLAACASTPRRPPPDIAHPPLRPTPVTPVQPPKPTTAALAGVRAGPAIESLGLTAESARGALAAFRLSCPALVRRADPSELTRQGDWTAVCADAMTRLDVDGPDFFARWFETAVIGDGASFATGYYEPEIMGSRTPYPGYDTPIYRRPPDLVDAEFTANPNGPTGRKQRGRMQDGQLVPYYDRAAIDAGALAGQGLEIAWARDPIEFFFLQIQGSGRLLQPDGTVMRIGYDGQNGREYLAIGRSMRDRGLLGPNQLSMQGVMAGLRAQPDGGRAIMEEDKSYIFFREVVGPGPLGALGVQVVGHVSVAADPKFIPLGAPLFLTMDRAEASGIWVAQDTGGAIKGANRFDTFWGAGQSARTIAGGMSARGRALLLLPKGTVARLRAMGDGEASAQR
ncbi:murein transglycosylase A [Sphingomonas bacterium]|uniref:murein transglycosylase A n=1 Tax=Sphingomonas bacterium TaxID=1895847 RepID=UPI00157699C3